MMISFDFDGVLGVPRPRAGPGRRRRRRRSPCRSSTPVVRAVKRGLAALTEGLRQPLPRVRERPARAPGFRRHPLSPDLADGRAASPPPSAGSRTPAAGRASSTASSTTTTAKTPTASRLPSSTTHPIDTHVDDDPETVACLSRLFPDKRFVRLDHYRRKGPSSGANIATVREWDEVPALLLGLKSEGQHRRRASVSRPRGPRPPRADPAAGPPRSRRRPRAPSPAHARRRRGADGRRPSSRRELFVTAVANRSR
ncbi:MAG: hypothetical protein M0C28_41960 [Candidatus Moduliflexus flocculans]|nr:hypothetical protein [Candidatus Moduliflexus flocculans]